MTERALRVVYIAGYGHSGSTILNIVLGQHPEVMGAGELVRLASAASSGEEFCSCGEPLTDCRLWRAVVRRWAAAVGEDPIGVYAQLQQSCERSAPAALPAGTWDRYGHYTRKLLTAIHDVSGKAVIVDSSKLPARALALSRVPGIDLRILHVVRDGRGVAWSLRRQLAKNPRAGVQTAKRKRSVLRTGLLWMIANLAAERAARAIDPSRVARVRYEGFVTDPAGALRAMGESIGVDLSSVTPDLADGQALAPGHVMSGNRARMADSLHLKPDFDWRGQLPRWQRRLFEAAYWPVLRRYGYGPSEA
jgi:hypothetical protein